MTSRRSSGRGQPQATWKDPRRRPELLKAIGAGSAVVLVTALVIFLIKPGDSAGTAPTQTPVQTQTPVTSLPTGSGLTPDSTPTPSDSTASSTTPPQP